MLRKVINSILFLPFALSIVSIEVLSIEQKNNIDEVLVHVNGGKTLYKRRGGLKNAIAELKLQLLLYQCKIKPLFLAFFHLILRGTFLLLPSKIVEKIYIKKFRNKN